MKRTGGYKHNPYLPTTEHSWNSTAASPVPSDSSSSILMKRFEYSTIDEANREANTLGFNSFQEMKDDFDEQYPGIKSDNYPVTEYYDRYIDAKRLEKGLSPIISEQRPQPEQAAMSTGNPGRREEFIVPRYNEQGLNQLGLTSDQLHKIKNDEFSYGGRRKSSTRKLNRERKTRSMKRKSSTRRRRRR